MLLWLNNVEPKTGTVRCNKATEIKCPESTLSIKQNIIEISPEKDTNFPKERKNKRTCNERKNNKEEKAGVKIMPTHNLANRRTPDHI